jgi:hypothetical protein
MVGDKVFKFSIRRYSQEVARMYMRVNVRNSRGQTVTSCDSRLTDYWISDNDFIEGRLKLSSLWLKPGSYTTSFLLHSGVELVDLFQDACQFEISPALPYKGLADLQTLELGVVLCDFSFETENSLCSAHMGVSQFA